MGILTGRPVMPQVRRIAVPTDDLTALAGIAAGEGFRMLTVLLRDWADGSMRFTAPGEALFAARDTSGLLLGVGGITRDPWIEAFRMRRFYVRPEARGSGAGRLMAEAALDHARLSGAMRVRLRAPATAFLFWEALGFIPQAGDPQATHVMVPDPH